MSELRHVTNMALPADEVDMRFLLRLGDYEIGAPRPTREKTRAELAKDGIAGVYATHETLAHPDVKKLTGWMDPRAVLGETAEQLAGCETFADVEALRA